MAKAQGLRLKDARGGYVLARGSNVVVHRREPPYGLPLDQIEKYLIKRDPDCVPEIHPLGVPIENAIEDHGGTLGDWTVMSDDKDPFRMAAKESNHVAGRWLRNRMDQHNIRRIHNRGLHYVLLSAQVTKPDGTRYANTDEDWEWLVGVSGVARWLGYVPWEWITDEKNAEPITQIRERTTLVDYVANYLDIEVPETVEAEDIWPRVSLSGFVGEQPYRIAMIGEKTSLAPVLGEISERYGTDLCLLSGNISNTRLYELAKAAADDGRPLVVLYFSDCDPWGWSMGIEASRKFQSLQAEKFPDLVYRVYRAALTPEQVLHPPDGSDPLPSSPIEKGSEAKRQAWIDAMGCEQTEIDAIATLRPDLLRQIATEWIEYFYDTTLDERSQAAAQEWEHQAQQVIDAEIDSDTIDSAAVELAVKCDEIRQFIAERIEPIIASAEQIELPELPEIPEPEIDLKGQPMPLIDSEWSWVDQTNQLRASKNYED
jgi:hypothetical protein